MNKRIKKKKEILEKLVKNEEYSKGFVKFESESDRKKWVKYMTYKA